MRQPIIELAFVEMLSHGRGFRAGFRSWRFGMPLDHFGAADSAHGALIRAVAHMARVNSTPEQAVKLLRDVATEMETWK